MFGQTNTNPKDQEVIQTFQGTVDNYIAVTCDQLAYDNTNKQLLLRINGADTVVPF